MGRLDLPDVPRDEDTAAPRKRVQRYEILILMSGELLEIRGAVDAPNRFITTPEGVLLRTDSTTGKKDGDTEFWPWHRVDKLSRGRCYV